MRPNALFSVLESAEFFAEMSIASDINSFVKYSRRNAVVVELLDNLDTIENQIQVVFRVIELLKHPYETSYVRPADTALAIYIWVLSVVENPLLPLIAEVVASEPNTWWSMQMAKSILRNARASVDASGKSVVWEWQGTIATMLRFEERVMSSATSGHIVFSTIDPDVRVVRYDDISTNPSSTESPPIRVLPGEEKYYPHITSWFVSSGSIVEPQRGIKWHNTYGR